VFIKSPSIFLLKGVAGNDWSGGIVESRTLRSMSLSGILSHISIPFNWDYVTPKPGPKRWGRVITCWIFLEACISVIESIH